MTRTGLIAGIISGRRSNKGKESATNFTSYGATIATSRSLERVPEDEDVLGYPQDGPVEFPTPDFDGQAAEDELDADSSEHNFRF